MMEPKSMSSHDLQVAMTRRQFFRRSTAGVALGIPALAALLAQDGFAAGEASAANEQLSVAIEQMTLHVVPQSHIDIAWWWRYDPETIHVIVKRTLERAFENFEKYPDY